MMGQSGSSASTTTTSHHLARPRHAHAFNAEVVGSGLGGRMPCCLREWDDADKWAVFVNLLPVCWKNLMRGSTPLGTWTGWDAIKSVSLLAACSIYSCSIHTSWATWRALISSETGFIPSKWTTVGRMPKVAKGCHYFPFAESASLITEKQNRIILTAILILKWKEQNCKNRNLWQKKKGIVRFHWNGCHLHLTIENGSHFIFQSAHF